MLRVAHYVLYLSAVQYVVGYFVMSSAEALYTELKSRISPGVKPKRRNPLINRLPLAIEFCQQEERAFYTTQKVGGKQQRVKHVYTAIDLSPFSDLGLWLPKIVYDGKDITPKFPRQGQFNSIVDPKRPIPDLLSIYQLKQYQLGEPMGADDKPQQSASRQRKRPRRSAKDDVVNSGDDEQQETAAEAQEVLRVSDEVLFVRRYPVWLHACLCSAWQFSCDLHNSRPYPAQ